jgi:hypothetical protein
MDTVQPECFIREYMNTEWDDEGYAMYRPYWVISCTGLSYWVIPRAGRYTMGRQVA